MTSALSWKLKAAKKSAILLLCVLLVLLAASFLPFGSNDSSDSEKAAVKEKTILLQQLQELNNLPPAVDVKLEPAVKNDIKEALYLAAAAKSPKEAAEKRKVEVLVKASEDAGKEIKKAGGEILNAVDSVDKTAKYFAVKADADKVAAIAADNDVSSISQRGVVYPTLDSSVPVIKADAFWNAGYKGNGIRVAVLDTGIDKAHPMLQGNIVAERDFTNSGSVADDCGHGTHVAGIVSGSKANGGLYEGVAPDAQLLNAKVITLNSNSKCEGKVDYIIAAIGWALDPDGNSATDDGAKVISMSLGGKGETSASLENELKAAVASGAVVVVSSGNCGSGCPSLDCGSFRGVTWPGNSPSVITVGAVDDAKNVACFSSGENVQNVGIKPDFAAPGVDVTSSVPGSGYESKKGTSMAAPHVSGAVALLLGKSTGISHGDVTRILEKTALDLGDIGKDTSYGFGMIDMAKALAYREGLEVSVELEKQIIAGTAQKIAVTIYDDVTVNSVKATITKPNNAKTDVTFSSSGGNAFTYDFTDTALMGNYVVDVTVNYGGTSGSSGTGSEGGGEPGSGTGDSSSITVTQTAYFKVTSLTGDFGNVEEISISQQQQLSRNLTANITFANIAAVELNFSALVQLLSNGTLAQEIRLPLATVAAGSKAAVSVNNALEVSPGNYTLRILTDYEAGSLMNETNITVTDDMAPQVLDVGMRLNLAEGVPQLIVANVLERVPLNGTLEVWKHKENMCTGEVCLFGDMAVILNVNYAVKVADGIDDSKTVTVTVFESLDAGEYSALLTLCDASGNCASNRLPHYNVTECAGKKLLVVKAFEEVSVFEKAAEGTGSVCFATVNKTSSGTPPVTYLEKFDAVVWTTGTDFVNIDGRDAAALTDYYGKKGKVVVEGSDVAFRHGSGSFMRDILHSELKTDLGFTVTSVASMSNLSINVTRQHPIVYGLASPLPFNATIDPSPDAIGVANGGVELAEWSGLEAKGSAIVAYESDDGKRKSLLLPFSVEALNAADAKALASNSLKWLLEDSTVDITPLEIRRSSGVIVEGKEFTALAVVGSTEKLASPPKVKVIVDGGASGASEGEAALIPATTANYSYNFSTALNAGQHTVTVFAGSDLSISEKNYVNNIKDFSITVYPKLPDLVLSGLAYGYDDAKDTIAANLSASNFGGTAVTSSVKVYLDGKEAATAAFELSAAETKQVELEFKSQKGAYDFKAVIDPDNKVVEHNESNNELQRKIYLCSKEKVLVVDDNDAAFFSTSEPSSSDEFMGILRNSGYCVDVWDEKLRGVPGSSDLSGFKAVIWSAGDYFNGTISSEDAIAIGNYSGGLLLEGSDVGLDNSESGLLQEIAAAAFSRDMLLNDSENESLVLKNHSITANISNISISKEKSPYPDAIEAVGGEVVAEWHGGKAAIMATARGGGNGGSSRKAAYYAFSVDGITEAAAMEKLVTNTVEWLLVKPNNPPMLQNFSDGDNMSHDGIVPAAIKLTMKEGETKNFSVLAEDPDGDPLTFRWLLNGTPVSDKYYFAFSPKYNESGAYNLTIIVSDGQAEARAEIIVTVLDILECDAAKQTKLCPLQFGVCKDSDVTCSAAGKWPSCTPATYLSYSSKYEVTETSCDGFDNDCDGSVDEGFGNIDNDNLADCVDDDNDNDGTKDDEDDLIGNESSINFTGDAGDEKKLKIEIEDSEDEKEKAQKVKWVKLNGSDKPLLQFRYNFSRGNILLRNLSIEKQNKSGDKGFTLVKGLDLKGKRKQVFVDRLVSGSNAVCVKDKEVSAIAEVTGSCGGEDETLLQCDFPTTGPPYGRTGWSCGGSTNENEHPKPLDECEPLFCQYIKETGQYQIYGLKHSGIMEACTDADLDTYLPVGCRGGTDCNDSNSSISPAATEVCNGFDDNCNGQIDENRACNIAPELQSIGNKTISENGALSFAVAATDNEGDSLAYNATRLPQGATFDNATATFAWTPSFTQAGIYAVTFNASDGLAFDYETINITVANVNRAPMFEAISNKTVSENATLNFTVGVTDPDGDSLAQLFVNVPEKLGSAQFSLATKEFKWTPTFDDSGTYTIRFTASDGQLLTNEFANVTVVNVNRPPQIMLVLVDPPGLVMGEGETKTFTTTVADADNDAVTTVWAVNGKTTSTEPVLKFTPDYKSSGTYSIEVSVSDYVSTTSTSIVLTVQDTLECGTGQTKPCPLQLGVCSNSVETCAAPGKWLGCELANYGKSYTAKEEFCSLKPNENNCKSFCDRLDNDCDGSADEERVCDTAPQLRPVSTKAVDENEALKFSLSADDAENDKLTFTALDLPKGASLSSSGDFSWTPSFDQSGEYRIDFTASDGLLADSETTLIKVANVNRPPEVKIAVEPEGSKLKTGDFRLVKAKAFDPDGDVIYYAWTHNGKLVSKSSFYKFTPLPKDSASHEFSVTVTDGKAETKAAAALAYASTVECETGEQRLCQAQQGVCGNSRENCANDGRYFGCTASTYSSYSPDYQMAETICDGLDNDCNGKTDDGLVKVCGGAGSGGGQQKAVRCVNGNWESCEEKGAPAPEPVKELCGNGIDDDGNGSIDEGCDKTPPEIRVHLSESTDPVYRNDYTYKFTIYAHMKNWDAESDVSYCEINWNDGVGWEPVDKGEEETPVTASHTYKTLGQKKVEYRCASAGGISSIEQRFQGYDTIEIRDGTPPSTKTYLGDTTTPAHKKETASLKLHAYLWNWDSQSEMKSCEIDWGEGAGWQEVPVGPRSLTDFYVVSHDYAAAGLKHVSYHCASEYGGTSTGSREHFNYDEILIK